MSVSEHKAHVLVVEDEPRLNQLAVDYLTSAGYQVDSLNSGEEAVEKIRRDKPDLVVLDLMLPGKDGLDICREVRQFSEVAIIMVTARVEEIDRLLGLELGADDYLCKPFSPRELVSRAKAILRRVKRSSDTSDNGEDTTEPDSNVLKIDDTRYSVSLMGKELALTPVELRLLKTLADHPGRVFSRDQLLDHAYIDNRVVTDRAVDSHIRNLRRKLEQAYPDQPLIRSVYGVGYKYEP